MRKIVSVIGQSDSTEEQYSHAYELGRLLAQAGYPIVCGGMGGVMEAVARGAAESDGMCIGLLPGSDPESGNAYLTLAIPTGLGHVRNTLVVRAGEIVIAIGGGYGTLSEIAFALTMSKVVIGINTWSAESHAGIPADVVRVGSAADAVRYIQQNLEGG